MKSKTDTNTIKSLSTFSTSIAAGILIGFGVIINLTVENPIIGSLFFGFGLLTIIALKLPLYTGRIGFLKDGELLPLILMSNLLGIFSTILIYILANPVFIETLTRAADAKFQKNAFQMLVYGVLCGMLIHFAVKVKETPITLLAVSIFILIGAEHCIADFPILFFNLSWTNFFKWVMVVIGNSFGAIFIENLTTEKVNEIFSYYTE